MVGIGASTDNMEALTAFLDGLPSQPDMAFAVVLHPFAASNDRVVSRLRRHTELPVQPLSNGDTPPANTVSVLPSGHQAQIANGAIHLTARSHPENPPTLVDTFFRSLANDYGERAVGILLSDTGSPRALGVRALKEQGGLVMAHLPEDPGSGELSIRTQGPRLIDVIDQAAQLGAHLPRYWSRAAAPEGSEMSSDALTEEAFTKIFSRLHAETGHDFSDYKRSMVRRRLRRRMAVHHAPSLSAYLDLLQSSTTETQQLFRELLIGVTRFFRNPEAFATLEETILPSLFNRKGPTDQIRVWSAGCATGEEAYSLAMLLNEYAASRSRPPELQIFATDPSPQALRRAREGRYPPSVATDLSSSRQRRFLHPDGQHYQVVDRLREQVLFAQHDLLTDPPFSTIDLAVCRNMLIYLRPGIHEHVLRRLRYALRPEGVLFLGRAESVGPQSDLFSAVDDSASLYRRTGEPMSHWPVRASAPAHHPQSGDAPAPGADASSSEDLGDFHQHVLFEGMTSFLVDRSGEILHHTEPAGEHLPGDQGRPPQNLLEAVPEAVRHTLRRALRRAFRTHETTGPTVLSSPDDDAPLLLWARPHTLPGEDVQVTQVLLHRLSVDASPSGLDRASTRDRGRDETAAASRSAEAERPPVPQNTEASNEELRQMNEELQSKNEEIAQGQEELRSMNAQLESTNRQLKQKLDELERTNNDLRNLIRATNVATLFLDRDLHLEWFTPQVREHFGIRESDTGRPISDVTPSLPYEALADDAETVLDRLAPIERELQGPKGTWFLARLHPYRTLDDDVEGVVVTFVDITDRRQAELEVRADRNFIETLLNTVGALIVVLDSDNCIVRFNQKCESLTGYSAADVRGESLFERLIPPDEADDVKALFESMRNGADPPPQENHWITSEGERRLIRWSNTTLTTEDGTVEHIIGTGVDISQRRQLERELTAISDRERRRIGQDLHDLLASHLSGTAMMAQGMAQRAAEGQSLKAEEVREITTLIQEASEQARTLSHSLVPFDVHGDDLLEGFENLARRQENMTDVTCTVDAPTSLPPLAPDVSAHLYSIASEAVANAIKHGDADHITIRLRTDADVLRLTVQDDGTGLPGEIPDNASYGLKMMRYRCNLIGGRIDLRPTDGSEGGTVVQCSMPLTKATQSPTANTRSPSK